MALGSKDDVLLGWDLGAQQRTPLFWPEDVLLLAVKPDHRMSHNATLAS